MSDPHRKQIHCFWHVFPNLAYNLKTSNVQKLETRNTDCPGTILLIFQQHNQEKNVVNEVIMFLEIK